MALSWSRGAAVLAAAALATTVSGAAEPASDAVLPGEVFFASNRAEDLFGEVYAIQVDGSRRRRLSRGPRFDGVATPSPDGRRVAFVSTRSGVVAIWVVNTDGSGLRQASASLGVDTASGMPGFSWAPSARKLVYARSDVYVLDLASRRSRRIGRKGWAPFWSPDGSRIAYTKLGRENQVIVVRPNGRLLWHIVGRNPHWSPEGGRIAITTSDGKAVLILASSGRRLSTVKAESFVSWSPSGNAVLVRRGESLEVVSLTNRPTRRLSHADFAVWSPNGRLIAFSGKVGRRLGLFVSDPARGNPRYLGKWTWVADWSPTSNALLTNVDDALQIVSLNGRRRTVTRAAKASSFGGIAHWLGRSTIVYSSGPRWNPPVDLYRFSAAQGVKRLTRAPYIADEPTPSPDGRRVAFVRGLQTAACKGICETEIFLSDSIGRNVRRLTRYRGDTEPFVSSPTWSPSGDRIAFLRQGAGGEMSIRVVPAAGGVEQVLISNQNDDFEYFDPAWSPDGSRIAFSSYRQDVYGIYVMNPDGTVLTRLARGTDIDFVGSPAWSPDGARIAFVEFVGDDEVPMIDVMNVDGTARTRLGRGSSPAWSPEGDWIAYADTSAENTALRNTDLFVMRPDGSERHPVLTHPADEYSPSWKP
jgi:Tol biopolymer transport system component